MLVGGDGGGGGRGGGSSGSDGDGGGRGSSGGGGGDGGAITGDHSKYDQILLVKIGKCKVLCVCVYHRSYLLPGICYGPP